MPFSCNQIMGKFEYALVGIMAFLVLGILGMIAVSPENTTIDLKEDLKNMETSTESKSTASVSIGGKPLDPEPEVTIGESLKVEIKESESFPEPQVMSEPEPAIMEESVHTHEIIIPEGVGVPGCEENNECYVPYSISIKSGHAVMWTNEDTAAHTVTSGTVDGGPDGIFDSSIFMSGTTFEHTFEESGSFDYFCIVHPWMTGTIEVV